MIINDLLVLLINILKDRLSNTEGVQEVLLHRTNIAKLEEVQKDYHKYLS
jgi:hypothetical protein